jgi:hypothetical protein
MRTTITTASLVALLATGAGSAAASPRVDPGIHAQGLRYKAEAAYYLHHTTSPNAQDVARGVYPGMRPAQPARTVAVARSGFDWGDAGIGAGLTAALLLSAAGAAAVLRQHPTPR